MCFLCGEWKEGLGICDFCKTSMCHDCERIYEGVIRLCPKCYKSYSLEMKKYRNNIDENESVGSMELENSLSEGERRE